MPELSAFPVESWEESLMVEINVTCEGCGELVDIMMLDGVE